jgi:hypothetical protein
VNTKIVNISGYTVELETYSENGEPRSDCTVSKRDYSASLACLEYGECLEDSNGNMMDVHSCHIARIAKWAIANGY